MATVTNTTSPPRRWTPNRIRKALALPKPQGAIAKAEEYTLGKALPDLTPLDRQVLREIAENADVLEVVQTGELGRSEETRWLLVPAPMWLIEALALFEAEQVDLEPENDSERGEDFEPSDGSECGQLPTEMSPDWKPWTFLPSEVTQ